MLLLSSAALTVVPSATKSKSHEAALVHEAALRSNSLVEPPSAATSLFASMELEHANPFAYAKHLRTNPACRTAREDQGVPKNTVRMGKGSRGGPGPFFFNHEVRPVKMMTSDGCAGKGSGESNPMKRGLVGIPIPKCASTTMQGVMKQALHENCGRQSHFVSEHEQMDGGKDQGPEGDVFVGHTKVGRFDQGPITTSKYYQREIANNGTTWTIVRDPFTRFVSGMVPHGEYKLCAKSKGGPKDSACDDVVALFTAHALKLDRKPEHFPYNDGKSSHWLSQTYWLTATDSTGSPLHYDFVARVEQLEDNLKWLFGETSVRNSKEADRSVSDELLSASSLYQVGSKNHKDSTAVYVEALLQIPQVACAVCSTYKHDYDCLGYARPAACTQC